MNASQRSAQRLEKPLANSVLRGFDRQEFARARKMANLTVQELGKQSGVDRAAIHRWESGECLPLVDSLSLAAAALGATVDRFLTVPEAERTLADLRIVAGLTQAKLAERTGISRRVLGNFERGRGHLDNARAAALADALKVSETAIFEAHSRSNTLK
ncbi:helix-turn-helix transcriptional regulator [Mycobacterium hubeiense]|uniref:helix-turn-helix transcriptional regulator n=1 Tax=Mycobacterium hubeiense TaxID=1867256 RepID=UPI000C7F05F1|nr:helix-turn-helix transcriptional regulator [Mycobacterium sp. QGD 101]